MSSVISKSVRPERHFICTHINDLNEFPNIFCILALRLFMPDIYLSISVPWFRVLFACPIGDNYYVMMVTRCCCVRI